GEGLLEVDAGPPAEPVPRGAYVGLLPAAAAVRVGGGDRGHVVVGLGAGVADGGPQVRGVGAVQFVQCAAVAGHAREDGGGVAQPDRAAGADVDDALGRGQRGGVHGPRHVAHVDEVALGAESAQLELAVAGLHGASHGLGETAEGGAGGGARPGGREDPKHDGVQAGPEDEFGGGQLADAVRAAGARDGVLRGGGAGLAGAVLGAAPDLDEPGAAAAAAQGLADGGDGDGVVPGEFARAAAGGARAVDDDTGVDGVEEPGECAGAAGGEVEADVGVVAAAEGGELDGRVGEQAVGDEAAEVTV